MLLGTHVARERLECAAGYLGKVRHVEVEAGRNPCLGLVARNWNISGVSNTADLATTLLPWERIRGLCVSIEARIEVRE